MRLLGTVLFASLGIVLGAVSGAAGKTLGAAGQAADPFARMAWLVGDWECVGSAVTAPNAKRVVHNHVALSADGNALEFSSTLDAETKASTDVLGYDVQHQRWYEHTFENGHGRQELFGGTDALAGTSLTLLGTLELAEGKARIRTTYTWTSTNAYRFEGAAWTTDEKWQTLEVHDCKRTT